MVGASFHTETTPIPDVPDAAAIQVRGRVRYGEAPELRKALLDWIRASAQSRLIIELDGVDDMDTSGAAVLVEALVAGRDQGKRVLLCSPSDSVVRLFRLAGFEEALRACCATSAEARRRLGA